MAIYLKMDNPKAVSNLFSVNSSNTSILQQIPETGFELITF